jgi:hypothetical protein
MPTTFDGPARAIKPPGPDPPAEAAPPPGAGWLARTCCRVAGHAGDWTYPDEPVRSCPDVPALRQRHQQAGARVECVRVPRSQRVRAGAPV